MKSNKNRKRKIISRNYFLNEFSLHFFIYKAKVYLYCTNRYMKNIKGEINFD